MSETPRTDVEEIESTWIVASHTTRTFVSADFARTLERENKELRESVENWKKASECEHADKLKLADELSQLRTIAEELAKELTRSRHILLNTSNADKALTAYQNFCKEKGEK